MDILGPRNSHICSGESFVLHGNHGFDLGQSGFVGVHTPSIKGPSY